MITIIAQSLRIARNISYILQADIEMDGYYANDKYFITWTYGHMVEINTPRGNTGYWFHDASFPVLPKEYALNAAPSSHSESRNTRTLSWRSSKIFLPRASRSSSLPTPPCRGFS